MQIKDFKVDESLKELTSHRTVVMPVACYETKIADNIHGIIPLHWHEEIQFILSVKGEAIVQINEEKLAVKEGEGIFINSGCLHSAEDLNGDCVYICLNVSPHFLLPQELYSSYIYPYISATNLPYIILNRREDWGKSILESIMEIKKLINDNPPFYEINITSLLTFIWQQLIRNGFQLEYSQTEVEKHMRMKEMLNWIHQHSAEKVTLADIAKAGRLSNSECCRYFKKILKTTPINYLIHYRIQKSLPLLQERDSNVTEVAFKVGFNSSSYFIEKFRKSMNMTPLAYKKNRN
ncbi:AraC family transcriptional regulator [Bacillus sp. CMF12]|uniref:AraC family transcriptional regulator n=1 Tax=Bacillaceae TaxID=186817 RepID=UPI001FB29B75|nr:MULTISPECIES: AraC family transcriptional regulator [Bacillaceae]UOE53265.1 helix-turn-helix transcriptional regulator [Cytobacillus oceanisediminis]USK47719.1 AraC family transcriptional regulator [Bacillus sp. CMF12]